MIDLDNISFDHCIKCTVCTAYCPVARVAPDYPGPKASGPDAERLRIKDPDLVDASLKYCTNCKRCEIACPSDVKIADVIQDARHKYIKQHVYPRDYLLSHTDLMGSFATLAAPLVNKAAANPVSKWALDILAKIPRQRTFPQYAQGTFHRWYGKEAVKQKKFSDQVVYFTGCYVNYNNHGLGRDMLRVLNSMGFGVTLAREKCCGVPLIANGYLERAGKNAIHNIKVLARAASREGVPIVSASSSCTFALKHEYPNLLKVDNSPIVERTSYITRFLAQEFENGRAPALGQVKKRVAFHAPCHLERMGGVLHTVSILRQIPGLELFILNSECCGIAGTYGFKKEYYKVSQDVGQGLFSQINRIAPDYVVTDCETCKWQIEMSTDYPVVHPVTLLAQALKP